MNSSSRKKRSGGVRGSSPFLRIIRELKFAPTVLIIACLFVFGWASLRANAAWQFFAAQTLTEQMYQARAYTPVGIDEAVARLDKALARFPNNPDFLDLSGHLKELKASQPGTAGAERGELLESAASDYRKALAARPLWPYSWANLLSVKDKLGQVDPEFNKAMNRAAETGPWEPRVQLQVVRSGIRHWDQLRGSERKLVQGKVRDALKVQPREVFKIVRDYGRPDLICETSGVHSQIDRWCGNVL